MGLLSVEVNPPKLSNFDRSLKKRMSVSPGLLYPVLFETCVPGDQVALKLDALVKTNALVAPLMGSFKLQFDYFFCPWRLYVPEFRRSVNVLQSEGNNIGQIRFPYFTWPSVHKDPNFEDAAGGGVTFNPEGYYISGSDVLQRWNWTNPSGSLFDYMGFPVGYQNLTREDEPYCAIPFLAYVDIFRSYYMDPQANYHPWNGVCYYSDTEGENLYDKISTDAIYMLLRNATEGTAFSPLFVDVMGTPDGSEDLESVGTTPVLGFLSPAIGSVVYDGSTYVGLFSRTNKPNMYETILNQGFVNQLTTSTRIQADGNRYTTIDQIRSGFKFYREKALSLLAGSRLDEWVRAQYGVKTSLDTVVPELLGTTSTYLEFEDVISQSATEEDPLGSVAGRGIGYLDGRKHFFRPSEYGTLVVIMSLQPTVDYFQGINPWLKDLSMNDVFVPALDNIGFEDVPKAELTVYPNVNSSGTIDLSNVTVQNHVDIWKVAIGKRHAWLKYHTNVNRLHGDFADSLRYWTLGRMFSRNQLGVNSYREFSTDRYIRPKDYSYIFADPTEQNFFVQVKFDMLWKRPISKRMMPSL